MSLNWFRKDDPGRGLSKCKGPGASLHFSVIIYSVWTIEYRSGCLEHSDWEAVWYKVKKRSKGHIEAGKKFEIYSKSSGNPVEDCKHRNNISWLIFLKKITLGA